MLLHKIIYILTEQIHIGFRQYLLGVLLVDDVLQEKHEQQVEGLEFNPLYFGADQLCELDETVGDADIAVCVIYGDCPGVEVDVQL